MPQLEFGGVAVAYHTDDPGSIPGLAVRRKSVRVSEVNFISRLPSPMPDTGYTKGTGGDGRIVCVCIVSCDQAQ